MVGGVSPIRYIGLEHRLPTPSEVIVVWVFRLIVLVVVVAGLVIVVADNKDQTVDLNFFNYEYLDTPLMYVVAGFFFLGFLMALAVMTMREWKHRREIGRLKRQIRNLERELADLRTLPLQELSGQTAAKGD